MLLPLTSHLSIERSIRHPPYGRVSELLKILSNFTYRLQIILKFMAAKLKKKSKKVRKISHRSASGKISVDTAAVSVLEMHEEETSSSASSSGYRGSIESVSSTSTSIDSQVELAENASVRRLNISGECR